MAKAKKLPSGRWRVLVYDYTDTDGKRKYQSFTADTKKEAEYMAANYTMNKTHMVNTQDITLFDAYTRYIESKSNVLSPSTVREYLRQRNKNFPSLMSCKINQLTQELIQIAVNDSALRASPKTVRNQHGLLSAVLAAYHPQMKLTTTLPQRVKPITAIPIEDEVKKLLFACKGTELYKAILLSSIGTLRRSEICALLKSDISLKGVSVTKAMVKDRNGEWVIKTTKTTDSQRFVSLPQEVIEELLCDSDSDRVVNMCPDNISNNFRRLSDRTLHKTLKFHSLRHHSASVLHSLGIPDKYIMTRGGWASRETLQNIYTHTMPDVEDKNNSIILSHFEGYTK